MIFALTLLKILLRFQLQGTIGSEPVSGHNESLLKFDWLKNIQLKLKFRSHLVRNVVLVAIEKVKNIDNSLFVSAKAQNTMLSCVCVCAC